MAGHFSAPTQKGKDVVTQVTQDVMPGARGWRIGVLTVVALLSSLVMVLAGVTFNGSRGDSTKPRVDFSELSFSFVPNDGQADTPVRFVANSPGGTLSFAPEGVSIAIASRSSSAASSSA